MNAKSVHLQFDTAFPDLRYAHEALTVLAHTILLHRSTGNFNYSPGSTSRFQIETVGLIDDELNLIRLAGVPALGIGSDGQQCNIRYPFIRINCEQLDRHVRREIESKICTLQSSQLFLSFYHNKVQKEKGLFTLGGETLESCVWEQYRFSFRIENTEQQHQGQSTARQVVYDNANQSERCIALGKELAELTLVAVQEISLNQAYVPSIPHDQSILGHVFSTQFGQCQPYLFRLSNSENSPHQSSPNAARKPFDSAGGQDGPDDKTSGGRRRSNSGTGLARTGMDLINVTKKFTNQLFFK